MNKNDVFILIKILERYNIGINSNQSIITTFSEFLRTSNMEKIQSTFGLGNFNEFDGIVKDEYALQSSEEYLVSKKYKIFEGVPKTFIIHLSLSPSDVLLSTEFSQSHRIVDVITHSVKNPEKFDVIEENSGIGSLTVELSRKFKRVFSVNSSEKLRDILQYLDIKNVILRKNYSTGNKHENAIFLFENDLSNERELINKSIVGRYAFVVNLGFAIEVDIPGYSSETIDFIQILTRTIEIPPSTVCIRLFRTLTPSDKNAFVTRLLSNKKISKSKRELHTIIQSSSNDVDFRRNLQYSLLSPPKLPPRIVEELRKYIFNAPRVLKCLDYGGNSFGVLEATNTLTQIVTNDLLDSDEDLSFIEDKSINIAIVNCMLNTRPRGYTHYRALVSKLAENSIMIFSDYSLNGKYDRVILSSLGVCLDSSAMNIKEWSDSISNKFRILDTFIESPGTLIEVVTYVCKKIAWGD